MERFYTIKDLASTLKVSVTTIRRLIQTGKIDAVRIGPQKQIRIPESEVQRICTATASDKSTQPQDKQVQNIEPRETLTIATQHANTVQGVTSGELRWAVINADVNLALQSIPNESINCVVTSPPYYWQRDYEVDGQIGHESTIEGYVAALSQVFNGVKNKLRPDGTLFLNLGDTYYSAKGKPHGADEKHNGRQMMRRHLRAVDGPGLGLPRKSLIGIPWRVALALQQDGWTLRSSVIWHRPASLPEPTAHDRPWRTFENVFIFTKGPRYWFNRAALQDEEDVWQIIARPENPGSHFAPYPVELVDKCLACGCPPGGIVLDPFVGSGTTMMSALNNGFNAIGIELKAEYALFAANRVRQRFPEELPTEKAA